MKEIKTGDNIRLDIEITEELQEATAKFYGLAIVELTRFQYCNFMRMCIGLRVLDIKNETAA
jgi:hypothetical protein